MFEREKRGLAAAALALLGLCTGFAATEPAFAQGDDPKVIVTFRRGDVDANGTVDLADTFALLRYFFLGGVPAVDCDRTFDIDDDGYLILPDVVALLGYQFTNGAQPPAPFTSCGADTTLDDLGCNEYPTCEPILIDPPLSPEELEAMAKTAHVLRRIAHGQTPALFDRVMELDNGADDYVAEQLDPALIDESGNDALNDRIDGLEPDRLLNDLYRLQILRALYSERQLQEVMTDFWDVHFSTYLFTLRNYLANRMLNGSFVYNFTEATELAVYYEFLENQAFRDGALGDFHDLLVASATSVSMLVYLDNILNVVGAPNENYAREILELHTMGVDNGYVQQDVEQLAKVFTGWTICLVEEGNEGDPLAECQPLTLDPAAAGLVWAFHFDPDLHDWSAKTLFDNKSYEYSIPADPTENAAGGLAEGLDFIEYLVGLTQTAEFVTSKLIQRLVSDTIPPSLHADAIDTWLDSGGDIREVLSTILESDEFLGPDFRLNKVKTPSEYIYSTMRAFQGETDTDSSEIINTLAILANLPFTFGTPDGYPEKGDDQMGTARVLERVRFNKMIFTSADALAFDDVKPIMQDHDVTLNDPEEIVEFWMNRLFAGVYNEVDLELAVDFLTTNDLGNAQVLSTGANLYETRIRKMLAFLASYPQNMKQ